MTKKQRLFSLVLVLGEGVQYIGDKAFYGSYDLGDVYLPSTLVKVGTSAFSGQGTHAAAVPAGTSCLRLMVLDGDGTPLDVSRSWW